MTHSKTSVIRLVAFAPCAFKASTIFLLVSLKTVYATSLTSDDETLWPLINENSIPELLRKKPKLKCVVGLTVEPKRLIDVRKNRMMALKEEYGTDYTNIEKIETETKNAKEAFEKYQWPVIDVTRKSVEEMEYLIKFFKGKKETVYGLAGLGDLYVSAVGGRNSKMGYYLGQGYKFTDAKAKFMKEITVEGADLAFAIGPKILKEFKKEEFPLLISVIEAICENKKLEINW